MPELIIAGRTFGGWTVKENQENPWSQRVLCKCVCGKTRKVLCRSLLQGVSKSCGCVNRAKGIETHRQRIQEKYPINIGDRFGRLTVTNADDRTAIICDCDCGNTYTVPSNNLWKDHTRSCGCIKTAPSVTADERNTLRASGVTLSNHNLYDTWQKIVGRCTDPDNAEYPLYGGAGITMHTGWITSPVAFISDVEAEIGPRPNGGVFHRIDNTGPFAPGNIRWGDRSGVYNPKQRARRLLTDEQRHEAVAMVKAGEKQYEVAELFRVPASHISMLVRLDRDGKL